MEEGGREGIQEGVGMRKGEGGMEGEEWRREGGSERGMGCGGREGRRDGGTERGKEGRR